MNLRKVGTYDVGLDIGTGSVGWAVVDENGDLCKIKGKNTWGSRLFESAQTAEATRTKRTLRRRYNRRKQRIENLRELVYPEIEKIDPEFFLRMKQQSLVSEDRSFTERHVLFGDEDYERLFLLKGADGEDVKKYPTIYHLRKRLVEDDSQEDIRLVYLALHHMMKYRGNFLIENEVTAKDADARAAIETLLSACNEYLQGKEGFSFDGGSVDAELLNALIVDSSKAKRDRQKEFSAALGLKGNAEEKNFATAIGNAVFGYMVTWPNVFEVEAGTKFSLDKDDKVEEFEGALLPEDGCDLFEALKAVYNAFLLSGILKEAKGGTLSSSMVAIYEQHQADLKDLKALAKHYFPKENGVSENYNKLFRGPRYSKDGVYVKAKAHGYTGYLLGVKNGMKTPTETFYSEIKNLFKDVSFSEEDQKLYASIERKMEEGTYLRKLRTSENGAIPHQLHLEELGMILANQGKYYPALAENKEKIESLLAFRIPYYVGPLGSNSNPNRSKPFGWAKRNPGMENQAIRPWNFDQIINRDQAAEDFITNLTGECSYYYGKPVIPKYSLLYSEFCVRQELNKCTVAQDGENKAPMDNETVEAIYRDVFQRKVRVTVDDVRNYLKEKLGFINTAFFGTQKENEFASSLKSYNDFKRILGREIETFEDQEMVEQLILWVTVFEDKKILKRRMTATYGPNGNGALSQEQIKAISKLRYTGWSNLSKEFLTEVKAEYNGRQVSIMSILRNSEKMYPMNLMQILGDERFGFKDILQKLNEDYLKANEGALLEDIPGSPAIKRGINQSLKIVEEITKIAGKPPRKIIVEMAREEVGKGKGRRTNSRAKALQEAYKGITQDIILEDDTDLKQALKQNEQRLDNDKIFLYLQQRGKCVYCGKPLDINDVVSGGPGSHIDHIVPQSTIKDDSLDNRVLVHLKCNESKTDQYPLPSEIRDKRYVLWRALKDAGLMSARKFEKLTCARINKGQAKGFINRQLVETRQISKHVVTLLQAQYPDSSVETVKAELSHNLRIAYGLPKVREVNDWHHAHDAYLACQLSRFIHTRFKGIAQDLEYSTISRYAMAMKGKTQGNAGLIVNSFKFDGASKETGEVFRDTWMGSDELDRIRRCLNYKDCFVSRKLERLTGEFWNQTVYSPRATSAKAIPLKKGLNPNKYGYYMSPNSAYYAVIRHTEEVRGKAKEKISMVGVPVDASYRIDNASDPLTLESYLSAEYEGAEILKAPIYKYQKIKWDGVEYYLTSPSEMINARQLWLPSDAVAFLAAAQSRKKLANMEETEFAKEAANVWEHLVGQIEEDYPRYAGIAKKLTDGKTLSRFMAAGREGKVTALMEIVSMLHCDAAVGLKENGLAGAAGRMNNLNFGGASADITYIDTSVTGMFERRSKIEL